MIIQVTTGTPYHRTTVFNLFREINLRMAYTYVPGVGGSILTFKNVHTLPVVKCVLDVPSLIKTYEQIYVEIQVILLNGSTDLGSHQPLNYCSVTVKGIVNPKI